MRVVLDSNILVSALLLKESPAANLLEWWRHGRFALITAAAQLQELARVLRYPKIRARVPTVSADWLVAEIQELGVFMEHLPRVERSPDPHDNYLLAMAQAGGADYLVSGDKRDILALKEHGLTKILSLRDFHRLMEQ